MFGITYIITAFVCGSSPLFVRIAIILPTSKKTRNCEAPKIQGAKKTDQIIVVLFVAGNVAYEQKRHNKKQIKIPAK